VDGSCQLRAQGSGWRKLIRSRTAVAGYQFERAAPSVSTDMRRLRERRPIPGSAEEMLVEMIKACGRLETSPTLQRRVYARVLNVVLGRHPKVRKRSRLRPRIGLGVILFAWVAASALCLHWLGGSRAALDESPARVSLRAGHPLRRTFLGD
jgi:hypothetical protein